MGWWEEGSAIDKLDKTWSDRVAFSHRLGRLEYPLAVPGTFFGLVRKEGCSRSLQTRLNPPPSNYSSVLLKIPPLIFATSPIA